MIFKTKIILMILCFLSAFPLAILSGCKSSDHVTITPDGWRIHSCVPVDTNGMSKSTEQ